MGKIGQFQSTKKHDKARTACIGAGAGEGHFEHIAFIHNTGQNPQALWRLYCNYVDERLIALINTLKPWLPYEKYAWFMCTRNAPSRHCACTKEFIWILLHKLGAGLVIKIKFIMREQKIMRKHAELICRHLIPFGRLLYPNTDQCGGPIFGKCINHSGAKVVCFEAQLPKLNQTRYDLRRWSSFAMLSFLSKCKIHENIIKKKH